MSTVNLQPGPIKEAASANAVDVAGKTGRAIGWFTGQLLAANVVTFGSYIVLARLLDPKEFGLFAFASVFVIFLQTFTDQGIPDAIVQRAQLNKWHLDTAFWFSISVSFALLIPFWLSAPFLASALHEPALSGILRCLVWVLPISTLGGIHQALLERRMEYRAISIQGFIATLISTATAVVLALKGFGILCLIGQQLANATCLSVMAWISTRWVPGISLRWSELRELIGFSVHITLGALLDFINRRADDFLIGLFLGTTSLGYYSLAYKLLLTFTKLVSSPFNSVAFPAFSRLQNEPGERQRMFERLVLLASALAFPAFLGLAVVSRDLVQVVFGEQWLPSVPVLQILCFVGVLHSVVFLHGTLIRAAGRPQWQMLFTLGGALTNLIGFCFVVHWGMVYVALWYVVSAYLWLGVDLMLVQRILGHSTFQYVRGFLPALLTGIAVSGAVIVLEVFLPKDFSSRSRLAMELIAGSIALAFIHSKLLLNPRLALQSSGLMPRKS